MLAASRYKAKMSASAFLRNFNLNLPSSQKRHFVSSVISRLDISGTFLRSSRHYQYNNYVTFIPTGASRILRSFSILGKPIGSARSESTQASPDEEEMTDATFNQIISTVENDTICSLKIVSTYIDKLCRTGNLSTATRLLQYLRDKHIFLNPDTYNLLLVAANEGNDIDLLTQTFKDLLVSSKCLSSTSYLNLAKAFMKTNDIVLLLKFVREISELTFPRSATVLNRIIFAFAESRQIDNALLIFGHMKSLKCKPDLITYNTILNILGRAGRVDEMLHEFDSMKEANIVPDIISYNTLINSLRKVGRLDLCLAFFREMGKSGFEPDLRTYTSLIEGFGRSGNIEESLRLFREMKQDRICPSIYIYRSLISNLKKMGKFDLAMSLSEEMNSCLSELIGPEDFKRKNR